MDETTTPTYLTRDGGAIIWTGPFETRDVAKSAGMRWNADWRRWTTTDLSVAAKLCRYADETLRPELETLADAHAEAVTASRAEDADLTIPVPDGLAYRPFQKAGIAYASQRQATLLGDEMGLGKTVQVAGLLNLRPEIRRVVIICPATLRLNWQRELERWLVTTRTIGIATTKVWPDTDIVIANFDVAWRKRVVEHLHAETWDLAVVDEAHFCKNPKAKRTQAIVGSDRDGGGIRATVRLVLTGTPIPNRPVELFAPLRWLDPSVTFWAYVQRFCNARNGRFGWDFSGASNLGILQDELRSSVMVRRLKQDVLTELPAKERQVVEVPPANGDAGAVRAEQVLVTRHKAQITALSEAVMRAEASDDDSDYDMAVLRLIDARRVAFDELSVVRHQTSVAKVPTVVAHVTALLDGGVEKVVLFGHHHDVISGLRAGLGDYDPVVVTGKTPLAARQAAVDRFQTTPDCRVFLGSIGACGTGITLTAASHVVFAELDWTPANVTQAEDRCHRIGQRGSVLVQHIVLAESIDVRMAKTLVRKQSVLDRALDTEAVLPWDAVLPEPSPQRQLFRAQAQLLTSEQIAVIHESLRALSGVCDGASERDDMGFNGADQRFGNELAGLDTLTQRQAMLSLRMVKKYERTQLGSTTAAALQAIRDDVASRVKEAI